MCKKNWNVLYLPCKDMVAASVERFCKLTNSAKFLRSVSMKPAIICKKWFFTSKKPCGTLNI
jgi:hypothetical protein